MASRKDQMTESEIKRLARVPSEEAEIVELPERLSSKTADFMASDQGLVRRPSDPLIQLNEDEIHVGRASELFENGFIMSPNTPPEQTAVPMEAVPKMQQLPPTPSETPQPPESEEEYEEEEEEEEEASASEEDTTEISSGPEEELADQAEDSPEPEMEIESQTKGTPESREELPDSVTENAASSIELEPSSQQTDDESYTSRGDESYEEDDSFEPVRIPERESSIVSSSAPPPAPKSPMEPEKNRSEDDIVTAATIGASVATASSIASSTPSPTSLPETRVPQRVSSHINLPTRIQKQSSNVSIHSNPSPDFRKMKKESMLLNSTRKSSSRPSSMIMNTGKIAVTNLDEIPQVRLPGFNPVDEPTKPKESLNTHSNKPGLFRALSQRVKNSHDPESDVPIRRQKSLIRPERRYGRSDKPRQDLLASGGLSDHQQKKTNANKRRERKVTPWLIFSYFITCYCPSFFLKKCGSREMGNRNVRIAWREKMALVTICVLLCLILGFLTFGLEQITCGVNETRQTRFPFKQKNSEVVNIRGDLYRIKNFQHPGKVVEMWRVAGRDLTWMFRLYPQMLPRGRSACDGIRNSTSAKIRCTVDDVDMVGHCHTLEEFAQVKKTLRVVGQQAFDWDDIQRGRKYIVYNGWVMNLDRYFKETAGFLGDPSLDALLVQQLGRDATRVFQRSEDLQLKMDCLLERFKIGYMEKESPDCFAAQFFMYLSLSTILAVLIIRFILATVFNWTTGRKLGKNPGTSMSAMSDTANLDSPPAVDVQLGASAIQMKKAPTSTAKKRSSLLPTKSRFSSQYTTTAMVSSSKNGRDPLQCMDPNILRTIVLITCYSEDEVGIRATLDSIARTDFPDSHKLMFIIADGLITGSGNNRSTPDILINMIQLDEQFAYPPPPHSYVAIAEGQKRHNMAQVFAGRYFVDGHSVPVILVVKCGTPEEQNQPKAGNRGKRDSQIILMQFLSKVMFDDRMTPLEFDIFTKMTAVSSGLGQLDNIERKVTPDMFELVLFVDADTKVLPDALTVMSYAMAADPKIIGLCGETRIANKRKSLITAIQVFEYYISHFLMKSFESVFGGVTCLPGCFCMYRIKAPKFLQDGEAYDPELEYYVPILANPDIVEAYSEHIVETLHEKNLLLLGEDRYLTTLMLKNFPKRNLVFVPNSVCKTQVPETFSVLLSQRRRWINSTVHNLLELVLVRDLCGIFCFSMQFVIFMELIGTAVLPAAICFTVYLIIASIILTPPPLVPLGLLAAILLMPALLILLTGTRWSYLLWMLIYLISLPLWNFVLPVYAFWNFDNFTWGQTRKIENDDGKGHGDGEGEFDHTKIVMKRWSEWELERRRQGALAKLTGKR